jgi:hypothetical protein
LKINHLATTTIKVHNSTSISWLKMEAENETEGRKCKKAVHMYIHTRIGGRVMRK